MIILSIYALGITVIFLWTLHDLKDIKAELTRLKDFVSTIRGLHERDLQYWSALLEDKLAVIRELQSKKSPTPIRPAVVESQPKPEDWQVSLTKMLQEEEDGLRDERRVQEY